METKKNREGYGQKKERKTKYHTPPLKFDLALRQYIPDLSKIEELKKKLKKNPALVQPSKISKK